MAILEPSVLPQLVAAREKLLPGHKGKDQTKRNGENIHDTVTAAEMNLQSILPRGWSQSSLGGDESVCFPTWDAEAAGAGKAHLLQSGRR